MLLTRSDLSGIIVNKPVIDARTDPTRPPTGIVDLATNTYSPITQPRPLETWEKVVVGVGVVGAVGAVVWLLSRMPRSPAIYGSTVSYDAPTVVVRRPRPVVVYEEDEPTVVVDEAPALLVNPTKKRKKTKGRKSR